MRQLSKRRGKIEKQSSFEEIYVVLFRCDIIPFTESNREGKGGERFLLVAEMILERVSILNVEKDGGWKEKEN